MDKGKKSSGKLVVSGGDPSIFLDFIEKIFNQVPLLVYMPVIDAKRCPVGAGRNNCRAAFRFYLPHQFVAVISFISKDKAIADIMQKFRSRVDVSAFAPGQHKLPWIAKRIYLRMELGCKASATATQSLSMLPPFAPAACLWA